MSNPFPFQGDGFVLRAPQKADARSLADIEFDPNVKRYLSLPELTKDRWVEAFDPETVTALCVEARGKVAGRASISRYRQGRKGYAELSIVIGRPWWGSGLGTRVGQSLVELAFTCFHAKGIVGVVHPEHRASIALLVSLGFRRRGAVVNPPKEWQSGHLIYRLPNRGACVIPASAE